MVVTRLEIMTARGLSYFLGTVVVADVAANPGPSSSCSMTSRNSLPSSVADSSCMIT